MKKAKDETGKTLPKSVRRDALGVCRDGLHLMNTPHAIGYAFNYNDKEVVRGMFISFEQFKAEFMAFYDFSTKRFTVNV